MNRGTIVRFQRQRANLSLAELAEKVDMSVDTIDDIESNLRHPKVYELEAMAVAMNIPYWYLGDKDPMENRVIISTHGNKARDLNGKLTPGAEEIMYQMVDYLEMDEYLEEALNRGRMDGQA